MGLCNSENLHGPIVAFMEDLYSVIPIYFTKPAVNIGKISTIKFFAYICK